MQPKATVSPAEVERGGAASGCGAIAVVRSLLEFVVDLGLVEDVVAVVGGILLDDIRHMAIIVDGIPLFCSSTCAGGAITLVA